MEIDYHDIELNNYEEFMLVYLTSVNALHQFQGVIDESYLYVRISEILQKNLYLTGRIIRKGYHFMIRQPLSISQINLNDYYQRIYLPENPFTHKNYDEITTYLNPYKVKIGIFTVNQPKEVLFKLIIFQYPQGFSIFFSMSHVVGDGETFYALQRMLNPNAIIHSLSPKRPVISFREDILKVAGKEMIAVLDSWSLLAGFFLNILFNCKPITQVFRINSKFIERKKHEFQSKSYLTNHLYSHLSPSHPSRSKGGVSYITTNDILMNTLAVEIFDSDFAAVILNFRDRIYTGMEDDLKISVHQRASNFVHPMIFTRNELVSSERFRQRLKTLTLRHSNIDSQNYHEEYGKSKSQVILPNYPTVWQRLKMHGTLFVSSWVNFYHPLHFPHATCILHLPLTLGGKNGNHAVIVFQPQSDLAPEKNNLAIVVNSTQEKLDLLRNHEIIDEEILW